jgi:hypothetical protein
MLRFEPTWSFLRASEVSSSIGAAVTASTVCSSDAFVFVNADGNCERFGYDSKEVADDGDMRDRFFGSGQLLANGE